MSRRSTCSAVAFAVLLGWSSVAQGATSYYVRLRPTETADLLATVAFDLTHANDPNSNLNRATLLSFTHDGNADSAEVEAGPGYGDLFSAANPAGETTLEGQYFYNSLSVPFDSLGTFVTLRLNLSEVSPAPASTPDEFSMYFINRSTGIPYPTADELGTNALFAVDITGQPGGELAVFLPMSFIPPDTIALDGAVVSVPPSERLAGRLQFRSVAPNPSADGVRLFYSVPEPGGLLSIKVFDVAGRMVAEPFHGKREAGVWTTSWDATTSGGRFVGAGVFIIQLQMAGQSFVRRVVLAR